jgi:hypothetical protein
MEQINIQLHKEVLTYSVKKLHVRWNPSLIQDLYVYNQYVAFKKKSKRDSWRIKRLK